MANPQFHTGFYCGLALKELFIMNRTKPNIVFYFSDQQRWDTLGCYGQTLDVTPNLDKLSKEGTKFQHAFTAQPVCGPTRACLQTGKYATEINCHINGIPLAKEANTIAKYLNNEGYETAYVGKWHLASDKANNILLATEPIPEDRRGGYKDYWMAADVLEFTSHGYNGYVFDKDNKKVDFIGYRADAINNFAVDYLHQKKSDKPFFLFISQIEPHHQNDRDTYEGPDGSKEKFKDYVTPMDLVGTGGNWRENYPDYLGCCHSLDNNVGKLIETLKEIGEYENTIIIYTSDHGSHFKTRNSEYKRSCHEASVHVPLIISGGAFTGGKVCEDLVSLIDLPTTILDIAGIQKPDDYRGHSLVTLVDGSENSWEDVVFIQISESQVGRAIRTSKWKYSIEARADRLKDATCDTYYEAFLYDLETDIAERNNLIWDEKYTEIKKELEQIIKGKILEVENIAINILPCETAKPVEGDHG